ADPLVHLGEPAEGVGVVGVDLEDDLAHSDRLDQEAVLRVALGRALERLDGIGIVAEPPVGLAGALGPLRVVGLEPLELEVGGECALVLAGRDSGCGLFAQCSTVLGHRLDADYRSERGARGLRRKYAPRLTLGYFSPASPSRSRAPRRSVSAARRHSS